MTRTYTELPYVFDLLYDIKSVEELHDHLTGRCRTSTSGTDAALIALARQEDIPLPPEVVDPPATLVQRHEDAMKLLQLINAQAKRAKAGGSIDLVWLEDATSKALTNNSITASN